MGLALLLADPERMARHGAGQLASVSLSVPGTVNVDDVDDVEDFYQNAVEGLFIPELEAPPVLEPESFFF